MKRKIKEDIMFGWKEWYWIALFVFVVVGVVNFFWDDVRVRRGVNAALLILFIIIGMIITSGPVK